MHAQYSGGTGMATVFVQAAIIGNFGPVVLLRHYIQHFFVCRKTGRMFVDDAVICFFVWCVNVKKPVRVG